MISLFHFVRIFLGVKINDNKASLSRTYHRLEATQNINLPVSLRGRRQKEDGEEIFERVRKRVVSVQMAKRARI